MDEGERERWWKERFFESIELIADLEQRNSDLEFIIKDQERRLQKARGWWVEMNDKQSD